MSKDRNIHPARTNQKLYFARLQIMQMEAALADSTAFDSEPRALSSREAAIWHLHSALGAFMQELSRFYKVQPAVTTPEAMAEAMAGRGQVSPEAQILLQLAEDAQSWLSRLRSLHAACYQPVALTELVTDDESPARIAIPLVMTTEDSPLSEPDRDLLVRIHQSLTQAIREFRAELVEF